jgi:hypothetical protein
MAKKNRELTEVIDSMLAVVPREEKALIESLEGRRNSCGYTAPEAMRDRWVEVAALLHEYLGKSLPDEDWKRKVYYIWMDVEAGG